MLLSVNSEIVISKFKFQYGATNIRVLVTSYQNYQTFKFQYGATNM